MKDFYLNEYPTDELGVEIDTKATFIGLLDALHKGRDVYEYIGVGDSLIRERLFYKLSELLGKAYNDAYIYNLWLK
jgi:hypothetical protein